MIREEMLRIGRAGSGTLLDEQLGSYDAGEASTERLKIRVDSLRRVWLSRSIGWALAAWGALLYGLTFLHLEADFPNHSPWLDWAKTTDEGWYSGGALHHFVFGHWYLPNAFNPVVAMPAWPLMLGGWFSLAGPGMAQARALSVLLYGASLILLFLLLREADCGWILCAGALLLIAANPFCYVFDRMAILEPAGIFWWLLTLWLAGKTAGGAVWRTLLSGALLFVLVLTKPTNVVLAPSVLYFLYARACVVGRPWKLRMLGALATGVLLWLTYFLGWVRPRYLRDYRFVFAINAYRIHGRIIPQMTYQTLREGLWINAVLFPLGLGMVLLAALWLRGLWRRPLFTAAGIAMGCTLLFILYHGNFQPRYYLPVAWSVVIVVLMGTEELWRRGLEWEALSVAAALLLTAVSMTVRTGRYIEHPQYIYRDMARDVARRMSAAGGSPVLLSASGDDISLFTGVRAISLYQPAGMKAILESYHPTWLGVWLPWEKTLVEQVGAYGNLKPVATFHVYQDVPSHDEFVLYRRSSPQDETAVRGER